ncbi:uncharacterized protein Z519_11781 [Cladophialophora bantiana CBS 173.52]|uniref:Unplaced genomic scaffold supercont1.24, whole genome shotgun sequence n=1 Tax=Cladophialophora bantiana (strain ATCC 10958 / CBS 173.52 / CDC B-1940 / NIH 8579) TaxID=1442370 RepID=A0A0D2HSR7_CLAB1|nr:uncharacterized protein Z519_11781 [Cladophialophora bantiana CBS 173.52]KIW87459.1 hypothetical protein Z519_11781 [Cladophialophora bantiana CBS 173.52]
MIASSWLKQSIITVLCVLGIPSYLSAPKPISVHLEGQSSITVPANRAIVSLRINAEGPKQDRVADEVRKTADDVLATLRPLAQLQPPQLTTVNATTANSDMQYQPPIVDLSVTTFRSYSWQKPGSLLSRETPQYQASVEIEAEFRDFEPLGILLAQVSKTPAATVQSLKWTLDDVTKKRLFSKCRSEAMVDALDKVRAYIRPLGMDKVRAIKVTESHRRSRPVVWGNVDVLRLQHDELDYNTQMEEPEIATERFGLEPGTLEIVAQIEGEFCAWKTGLEAWFRRGGV